MTTTLPATSSDLMTVSAARTLKDGQSCFVGIGDPSAAANLARALHAPSLVLIYESGCIGAKPLNLPLSIGDGELSESADLVVTVPEIFNYWLQPGRIDVGFLGAAQLDRYANLNSTVLGSYDSPIVRLPGAGGAPEIAASCREVLIMIKHSTRSLVAELDFRTTIGFGSGRGDRERLGMIGDGPSKVITDLGVLEPRSEDCELELTGIQPGVSLEEVRDSTGWDLRISPDLVVLEPPTTQELVALDELRSGDQARK